MTVRFVVFFFFEHEYQIVYSFMCEEYDCLKIKTCFKFKKKSSSAYFASNFNSTSFALFISYEEFFFFTDAVHIIRRCIFCFQVRENRQHPAQLK